MSDSKRTKGRSDGTISARIGAALAVGSAQTMTLTDAEGNQYVVPVSAVQPVQPVQRVQSEPEVASHPDLAVVGSLFRAIGDLAEIGSKTVQDMSGSPLVRESYGVGAIAVTKTSVTKTIVLSNSYKVYGYSNGMIDIYSGNTKVGNVSARGYEVTSLAEFNKSVVAGYADGTVKVFDKSWNSIISIRENEVPVTSLMQISIGLVAGYVDGTVNVWNTFSGNAWILKQKMKDPYVTSPVTSLAEFNNFVVAGHADGTVNVWDNNGILTTSLDGNGYSVTSIVMNRAGECIVYYSNKSSKSVKF